MHFAYRSNFNEGKKIRHSSAWEFYYCLNYYARKLKFEKHIQNCSGQPKIIHDVNIQNLVT